MTDFICSRGGLVLRRLISISMLISMAISGYAMLPHVLEAAQVFGFRHDPTKVLLYRLSSLDRPAFDKEIAAALTRDDAELARSLADLAKDRDIAINPATLAKISNAEEFSLMRSTGQLLSGAVTGNADSPTAFAGALASDLTVVGDLRDLTQQAFAYPDQDNLTVALAATGVVLTGATAASGGTSVAGKVGVSALKAAKKMGRLSKRLERQLVRLTDDALDTRVLKTMANDLGDWNFTAAFNGAKRLIKPRVVEELVDTGDSVRHVFTKQGYRATLQVLESADDTTDIRKLRRVSDELGPKFRGALYLKRGGKLVLRVAEIALSFLWWLVGAALWIAWAGYVIAKLGWKGGGLLYRLAAWAIHRHRPAYPLQSDVNGAIATSNS